MTLRRHNSGQLGFNVHNEGMVVDVEPNGLAQVAGLRQSSRLVEVGKIYPDLSSTTFYAYIRLPRATFLTTPDLLFCIIFSGKNEIILSRRQYWLRLVRTFIPHKKINGVTRHFCFKSYSLNRKFLALKF